MRQIDKDTVLLKEYVRHILLKEDEGDSAAMSGDVGLGAESPYGISFGSKEDMISTFISPFTDVFKTAVGKSKEISKKTQTLLFVGIQTILTTLIPIYGYNYAEVFDKEKDAIGKIRGEYQEVYDKTDKALSSNDAAMLAFMASPGIVMGAIAAKQAPKVAKALFSVVTGGVSDKIFDDAKNAAVNSNRWALGDDEGHSSSSNKKSKHSGPAGFDFGGVGESQINEEDQEKPNGNITPKKILTNKKFIEKSMESPKAKKMQQTATQIYRKSLSDVFSQAQSVIGKAKTVDDLERIAKKKLPEADKIRKLQGKERAAAEKALIDGAHKAMKDFYLKNLNDQVNKVTKAGIPDEAQYVKDFKSVIQKISSL